MAENMVPSPKKGKKRRKSDHKDDEIVEKKIPKTEEDSGIAWDEASDCLLVRLVEENCHRPNGPKLFFVRHVNWGWIAGKFEAEKGIKVDADQMKTRWEELAKKVRKVRTIPEMLNDVMSNIKFHVDSMPKKPIGAFTSFCMSKRARLKQKYPDIGFIELNRRLGKKWRELPAEKRDKYDKRAKERRDQYNEEMEEWKTNNPGASEMLNGKRGKAPQKKNPKVTAFKLFCEKKSSSVRDKHPNLDAEGVERKLKKKWEKLKEHKKEIFSQEAMKMNAKEKTAKNSSPYMIFWQNKRKELLKNNPKMDFGEVTKTCAQLWRELDPEEKAKFEDQSKQTQRKPKQPKKPLTAYQLYFQDTRLKLLEQNPKLAFGEIASMCAKEWKSLNDEQKGLYKMKEKDLKSFEEINKTQIKESPEE